MTLNVPSAHTRMTRAAADVVLVRAARHTVKVTLQARAQPAAGGGSVVDKAADWWPAADVLQRIEEAFAEMAVSHDRFVQSSLRTSTRDNEEGGGLTDRPTATATAAAACTTAPREIKSVLSPSKSVKRRSLDALGKSVRFGSGVTPASDANLPLFPLSPSQYSDSGLTTPPSLVSSPVGINSPARSLHFPTSPSATPSSTAGASPPREAGSHAPTAQRLPPVSPTAAPPVPGPFFEIDGKLYDAQGRELDLRTHTLVPTTASVASTTTHATSHRISDDASTASSHGEAQTLRDAALAAAAADLGLHALPEPDFRRYQRLQQEVGTPAKAAPES
jgi:hypothetical protein